MTLIHKNNNKMNYQGDENYRPCINSDSVIFSNSRKNSNNLYLSSVYWGDILGKLEKQQDLYLVLNDILSYSNNNLDNSIDTVKEALDAIIDKLFYKIPDSVKVNFNAIPYRNGQIINTVYNGMILDKIEFVWNYINYLSSIDSVTFNNQSIPINITKLTIQGPIISNVSKTLIVSSSYKDSKGVAPTPFNLTKSIIFNTKQYYWSSASIETNVPSNIKEIPGNPFNINLSGKGFIYLMFPNKKSYISIYDLNGVDPGGETTKYVGTVTYKEYDRDVTYYLYSSLLQLTGNWTVKYL